MRFVTVDFETEGIKGRPDYPPKPVGVALKYGGQGSRYLAWGHPRENNCTYEEALNELAVVWNDPTTNLVMQNAKFDTDVAEVHMGLRLPRWDRIHDTQYLIYLFDPHAGNFSLKPSAERILNWPPDEQDRLRDWILANVRGTSKSKKSENYWAGFIHCAPGGLVGEYACGDVDRTWGLFEYLMPFVERNGMVAAYERERRLMPIMLNAEREGVRTDLERMETDLENLSRSFLSADRQICDMLGKEINVNSGEELAEALLSSGLAKALPLTPTGRVSTARDALQSAVEDPRLLGLLRYRGVLKTCLGTFLGPWVAQAKANKGRLHCTWYQTRGDFEKGGTVTGRLSCARPNLMNIPAEFSEEVENLLPPPRMREYLLPEPGHVWVKRDYSAQEVRLLAHYEDGALMKAFQENTLLDPHAFGAEVIKKYSGHVLERKQVKIIVFSILYGSGVTHLSEQLGVPYHQAAQIKSIYLAAFPDVKALIDDVKYKGDHGLPIRTIGSRVLYAEQPHDGRRFGYKLLNHMIQGSAADATKEGIIQWDAVRDKDVKFLATVHDEINISIPEELVLPQMALLQERMGSVKVDVRLESEGYVGKNWHDADDHKQEKGEKYYLPPLGAWSQAA